jgi:predicted dehydrogenase
MMRAAILGVGFMGWIHYLAYQRSSTAKLIGFASRDPKKRTGDWTGIQGNFGPPGEQISVEGMTVYESLDQVLEDPQVDLVDLCTPPHLHVPQVLRCLQAGKHVLCEKPLALNGDDALKLVDAAAAANRLLLVGHVLPFMSEFKYLTDAAEDHRFGKLVGLNVVRTIGPVDWNPDFYNPQRVGGPLVDLHVHDTHLVRLLFGMPRRLHAVGRMHQDVPQYFETLFDFAQNDLVVAARGGVIDQHGRPFTHGFEAHFERATVQYQSAAYDDQPETMPLKVLHQDGSIERPDLGPGDPVDAFVAELEAAAIAVAGGETKMAMRGELAADALVLSQRIDQSIRKGEPVTV